MKTLRWQTLAPDKLKLKTPAINRISMLDLSDISSKQWMAAGLLALTLPISQAEADVAQFRQGENNYNGASDTYIVKRYPYSNFGSETTIKALGMKSLALLKWDVKSIPSTAHIDDVNIGIKVSNASKERFNVYAMTKAWQGSDATWAALQPNLQGSTILGSLQANSTGNYTIVLNPDGKNLVQSWIQGNPNYGFVIASDGAGLDNLVFSSRDAKTISIRPKLEISYSTDIVTTPVPTISPTVVPSPTALPTQKPTSTPTPVPKLATYSAKCSSCHGSRDSSNVSGSNASWIKDAITYDLGGMGYLSTLTNADLNSIATELGGAADLTSSNPTGTPVPTAAPTLKPTAVPTLAPTATPIPTALPTSIPTSKPTSTPTPTNKPTATPTPVQKLATYSGKCSSCHGSLANSNVSGSNASWIKDAIDYDRGGMGYLSTLTNADLNSIAKELGGLADLAVVTPTATPTPISGGGSSTPTPTSTPKPTPLASITPTPVPSNAKNVIDVMVLYTTANQTAAFAKQRLNFLVTLTNQAYKDSFIDLEIRLVHTEPTTYGDSKDNDTALDDLTNGTGVFSTVEALRTQYGADLVDLFRPFRNTFVSCGVAWLGMEGGAAANKKDGYSVVSDGSDKLGSGSYCDDVTFAHELGHNMGLNHERENSGGGSPIFPYAYAWGIDGTFGTVMGYDSPTLNYFSTPLLPTQCKGTPCGYPKTDAARGSDQSAVVNYTAPLISNFLPTLTSTPVLQ